MAVLTRIAQHKDRKVVNLLRKSNGNITVPGEDTILQLVGAHFPSAIRIAKPKGPNKVRKDKRSSKSVATSCVDFISEELVKASLLKFKPFKAAGPDNI